MLGARGSNDVAGNWRNGVLPRGIAYVFTALAS